MMEKKINVRSAIQFDSERVKLKTIMKGTHIRYAYSNYTRQSLILCMYSSGRRQYRL